MLQPPQHLNILKLILLRRIPETTPRLLINREKIYGAKGSPLLEVMEEDIGLQLDSEHNYRDVAKLGSCDDVCIEFAEALGWKVQNTVSINL